MSSPCVTSIRQAIVDAGYPAHTDPATLALVEDCMRTNRTSLDHLSREDLAVEACTALADLTPLAEAPEVFARNTAMLRHEYTAVPEPAWRAGRGRVLARFLAADRLFRTRISAIYEAPARANLTAEIVALSAAA